MQKLFSKESIAVLISGTRRSIKQYAWEKLRPWHVTPQQCGVLLALSEEGGMSLGEVASRTWCDNPTACRIVNKLVERGLVRSDSDAQDRRRFRLHLTCEGQSLCRELDECAAALSVTIEQGLAEEDLVALRRILRQVMSNAVNATQRPDKTIAAATASLSSDDNDDGSEAVSRSGGHEETDAGIGMQATGEGSGAAVREPAAADTLATDSSTEAAVAEPADDAMAVGSSTLQTEQSSAPGGPGKRIV